MICEYSNKSLKDLQRLLVQSTNLEKTLMLESIIEQNKEIRRLKNLNHFLESEIATLRTGAGQ